MFNMMGYTTQASFMSLLIHFHPVQKLMENNGSQEQMEKYLSMNMKMVNKKLKCLQCLQVKS